MREAAALIADARGEFGSPWLVFILVPALYVAGSFLLARFGGWRRWAAQFAVRSAPPGGMACTVRSVRIYGWLRWNYHGSLSAQLSPEGIFLRPKLSFSLFHPSLLLPWWCVQEVRDCRFLGFRWLKVFCRSDAPALEFSLPWSARRIVKVHRSDARPR